MPFQKGHKLGVGNTYAKGNIKNRKATTLQPFISPRHIDLISLWWSRGPDGYYRRQFKQPDGKWKSFFLHRIILERNQGCSLPRGTDVDHIDLDRRNNLDNNLRPATRSENLQNRGQHKATAQNPYRGVSWVKNNKKWAAVCQREYKRFHIGLFDTAEQANEACIAKRKELGFFDSTPVPVAA